MSEEKIKKEFPNAFLGNNNDEEDNSSNVKINQK